VLLPFVLFVLLGLALVFVFRLVYPLVDVSYLLFTKLFNSTFLMEVGALGSIFCLLRGLLPFFVIFLDLLLCGIIKSYFFFVLCRYLLVLLALQVVV